MDSAKAFTAWFDDLARGAFHTGDVRFSRFCDPSLLQPAREAASRAGAALSFWGGYDGAERVVAAFSPDDAPVEHWPIACVEATWNVRSSAPAHRDLLGGAMALGLERSCFGDIVTDDRRALMFVMPEVADYVIANFQSAGRTKLSLSPLDETPDDMPETDGRAVRETIGSMRLDAVVAAAWNLSRAQAQRLIEHKLVKKNHVVELRTDAHIAAGDLISARGYGRAKVVDEPAPTKKGRLAIHLFLYGAPK